MDYLVCTIQTVAISAALYHLNETGPRDIFKRLETIAVASIFGSEHDQWNDYLNGLIKMKIESSIRTCVDNFETVLSHLPLRHFCSRDSLSPCGMRPISVAESDDPAISDPQMCDRTFHYSGSTAELPLYVGGNMRWVCDAGTGKDWKQACFITARNRLTDATGLLRKMHAQSDNTFKAQAGFPIAMEMYSPTG